MPFTFQELEEAHRKTFRQNVAALGAAVLHEFQRQYAASHILPPQSYSFEFRKGTDSATISHVVYELSQHGWNVRYEARNNCAAFITCVHPDIFKKPYELKLMDYGDISNPPEDKQKASDEDNMPVLLSLSGENCEVVVPLSLPSGLVSAMMAASPMKATVAVQFPEGSDKRTLNGTANKITVTNGGISDGPTFSPPYNVRTAETPCDHGGILGGKYRVFGENKDGTFSWKDANPS